MSDIVERLARMTQDGWRCFDRKQDDKWHCAIVDARDEIERLRKALEPFANMVSNDNGDMTVSLSVNADDLIRAYFTMRRAALDAVKER